MATDCSGPPTPPTPSGQEPEPDWIYSPYITIKGKRIYRRDGKKWRFLARPDWRPGKARLTQEE